MFLMRINPLASLVQGLNAPFALFYSCGSKSSVFQAELIRARQLAKKCGSGGMVRKLRFRAAKLLQRNDRERLLL